MKWICSLLLSAFFANAAAQTQYTITGKVTEKESGNAIELATIQLLTKDSTYVGGIGTSKTGSFTIKSSKAGSYIIKASFVGYVTQYRNVTLAKSKPNISLGTIALPLNSVALKGATVTAKAAKVEMKADTFQYNASAYRVPVGSSLESLVEQLPGAEVSDDGTIKINGKTVSQILIDGKDFFRGDTKIAMKNLPTELVQKIKAYDKKSDYAEQTGVDDGEEETVIDLSLKEKLKESWVSNLDAGAGTKHRYSGNLFVNRFTDYDRETFFGNANNTGDRGFRWGRGAGNGLVASKSAGVNLGWSNRKKEREQGFFEISGNVRWNHNGSDQQSRSSSETFLNSGSSSSFSNSKSNNYSHSTNINSGIRLKWNPDTLTTITFRPSFSYSESDSWSQSRTATFNDDPYSIAGVSDPLGAIFQDSIAALRGITVNTNHRRSMGDSKSTSFDGWGMIVRRLNNEGRNASLSFWGGYGDSKSRNFSRSDIQYFQRTDGNNRQFSNQYTNSPSKNWNYGARLSYSEPIVKNLHAQFNYQYDYSYSSNDRSLYQLDSLQGWRDMYNPALGTYPTDADSLRYALNVRNSQYATYKNYTHRIGVGLRYNTKTIQAHAAIDMQPQRTKLSYQKDKLDTVVTRNVFNLSPNIRFRYKISETSQLDFRYRGSSSQPSMTDLLDVTDDSDPLYISRGNPGLKPSWSNNLSLFYNNYIVDRQMGWMANIRFGQTSNSISNAMHYDEKTGVRTTRPENINGNWNIGSDMMFNTAFGPDKSWNFVTFTNISYNNSVGYVSTGNDTVSRKNVTKTLGLGENLRLTYRTGLLEVGVNGGFNYQHSRNKLQTNANMDTWNFNYGATANVSFDWDMQISTDIRMNSRRGYSDASMNTNELIWNAQLSQSFLKGNAATLSVQLYDILHEQSNVSRTINAQMRSDTWNNSINSYLLVKFLYRLNIFGGKRSYEDNNDRGPGPRRGSGRPGGRMRR